MKNFEIERDEVHQGWIIRQKDRSPIGCWFGDGATTRSFDNVSISDKVLIELLKCREVREVSLGREHS